MRRVVVTGMGMVTPLGSGVDHNWSQIIAGKSGIARIEHFDVSDISCQICCWRCCKGKPSACYIRDTSFLHLSVKEVD